MGPSSRRKTGAPRLPGFIALLVGASLSSPGIASDRPVPPDRVGVTIVYGSEAPALLRQPTRRIRAYACREGALLPISFQVDERDRKDRWVLEEGPAARADKNPNELDRNDAILVRNRSLGDRCAEGLPGTELEKAVEVRVGSAGSPLGYFYAGLSDAPRKEPPASEMVRYDAEADRIDAAGYRMRFGRVLPDLLELHETSGESRVNVLDALHARGEARLFGGTVVLKRSEKDFDAKLKGYTAGPLRVVRQGRYWIRLPLGFRATATLHFAFYDDLVVASAVAKVRIPTWLIPGDGELSAFFDLRELDGATVLLDGTGTSGTVNGRMNAVEKRLHKREGNWAALLLPDGRSLVLVIRRGGALANLDQEFLFRDRPAPKPLSFGFYLSGVRKLETGEHPLDVIGFFTRGYDRAQIREAAEALLTPRPVSVRELP